MKNLPNIDFFSLDLLRLIQNGLSRVVTKAIKVTTLFLSSNYSTDSISERIENKVTSLTCNTFQCSQPSCPHQTLTIQPLRSTRGLLFSPQRCSALPSTHH